MAASQPTDSPYEINVDRFWQRIGLLHGHWQRHLEYFRKKSNVQNPYPGWNGSDSIVILCGKSDDAGYKRNNSIHIWLFGYELLSTIIIITKRDIYICAGSKTSQTLQQLTRNNNNNNSNNNNNNNNKNDKNNNKLNIKLITKNKNDGYQSNFKELTEILKTCGNKIGLIREEIKGFAEKFMTSITQSNTFQINDFGEALSDILMLKDKFETNTITKVSELTSLALKYFQKMMEKLIEKGQSKKHSEISLDLLRILENPKIVKSNLKNENLDVCYDPIIQSGGKYKLKPSSESNNDKLHYEYGCIVIMMGFRLRDYCSNIARTFLIDATNEQKEIYNILVTVFKKGLLMMRDNVELSKIYEKCVLTIKKCKRPYLEKYFLKNVGWGIGLEFRDKHYIIKKNNRRQAKAGMIFNFQVGFEGLTDSKKEKRGLEKAKTYSIIIADTVLVTDDQVDFLTKFNRKFFDYELNGDINEGESPQNNSGKNSNNKRDKSSLDDAYLPAVENPYKRVTRGSNRKAAMEQKETMKARRERLKKQKKLRIGRKKRLTELLEETGGDLGGQDDINKWIDPSVYCDSNNLPNSLRQNKVYVDLVNESLICPIMDHMVPYHITTIKNFSISTTPDGTYLRINFICPVPINSKNTRQPELYLLHSDSHFMKELTYRSLSGNNLNYVYQQLKELQKQYKVNKKNKILSHTLTAQDRLQRGSSSRVLILKELSLKPSMGGRKRGVGRLECHLNGYRYVDHKKNQLDLLFNNIKNAFFQKSKNTPAVIIHFHLKNRILINKKPSSHVQVFRDVVERFEELGRGKYNRRSNYNYDGIRAEQEEQKRIRRTNNQFKQFCEQSSLLAKENGFIFDFDKPAMDLMFSGVPNKQSTSIYPTENCLIALEDSPSFVIDCKDIEIAHFERVSYSLRNFDLVFVYKDFLREPHRVTTIPRQHLDTIQDFLNWKNVLYSQGKINLDWKSLMSKIRSNLEGFVSSGGWDFLLSPEDESNDSNTNNSNKPPSEDDYVPSEPDDYSSDDYSDDDDDDDDYDDDYETDYSDDDNNNNNNNGHGSRRRSSQSNSNNDTGLDWDELDRRALEHDRRANKKEFEEDRKDKLQRRNNIYKNNNAYGNHQNKRRRY